MITNGRKLSTILLLICYIAVSSIASAHAFPIFDVGSDSQDQSIAAVVPDMKAKDCHSAAEPNDAGESKSSVACKIFCSALAQVITLSEEKLVEIAMPCQRISAINSVVLSCQLAVEPHPPK